MIDQPRFPALDVLRSGLLSECSGVVHGFTGRVAGMGRADGNVGYSAPRDQQDAWAMRQAWTGAIGVTPDRLVTPGQVHGSTVLLARASDAGTGARPGSGILGHGDAMIAGEPGPVLFSLHADCLPLLLVDPGAHGRPRAVAAVHAGWRGTVADVAGAAVRAMHDAFGSDPADILAYIGPAIGPCCYAVGEDVVDAWASLAGDEGSEALLDRDGQAVFDLPTANRMLLARAGVRPDHVEASGICTRCGGDRWFSHRGQGAATGRFAAVIAITD